MIRKLNAYIFKLNILVGMVVFLNGIAPLSAVAKEFSASEDTGIEELYGDKILICTPAGFKYINIDEFNELESNGQNSDQSHCPLCQISIFATMLSLVDISSFNAFSDYSLDHKVNAEDDLPFSSALVRNIKARAPPIFL